MRYAFIILHYKAFEITAACVDSILALENSDQAAVIVVDNASGNGSGEALLEKYKAVANVKVLLRDSNDGYSRANNEGYALARKLYDPDFVIVANNDVEFPQKDFLARIERIYAEHDYAVLGPDTLKTATGEHQNPVRRQPMSLERIEAELEKDSKKLKNLTALCLAKQVKNAIIGEKLNEVIKQYVHRKSRGDFDPAEVYENVCIFGACQIFSRNYMNLREKLYYPETFFYYEEDIMARYCLDHGLKVMYHPGVQVYHLESASTAVAHSKLKQNMKFKLENKVAGGSVYRDMLKSLKDEG
ncbi:MAG: glycosyltransferase [Lachnospiraceae bacterium]|nr:glycosyltransferase [Lachnospiraceae bacterium]